MLLAACLPRPVGCVRKQRDDLAVTCLLPVVPYNRRMGAKLIRDLMGTAILVLACAIAVTACGSASKKSTTRGRGGAFLAFSKCMRAHGVSNFPDPSSNGAGLNLSGTGINPQSPSFRAAQASCFKLLPGGGPGRHASAQEIQQATEMAECMRKHGVTGYPDPIVTATPPNINPGEYSSAEYGNGIFIGIPSSINENSPAFRAASKACQLNT